MGHPVTTAPAGDRRTGLASGLILIGAILMGQLHHRQVSLGDLVRRSDLILVAVAEPARKRSARSGRFPPFKVIETLRNDFGGQDPVAADARSRQSGAGPAPAQGLREGNLETRLPRRIPVALSWEDLERKPVILFLNSN